MSAPAGETGLLLVEQPATGVLVLGSILPPIDGRSPMFSGFRDKLKMLNCPGRTPRQCAIRSDRPRRVEPRSRVRRDLLAGVPVAA